jgi:hypothetical protein
MVASPGNFFPLSIPIELGLAADWTADIPADKIAVRHAAKMACGRNQEELSTLDS